MHRITLVLGALFIGGLGVWCQAYHVFRVTTERARHAETTADGATMDQLLTAFEQSWEYRVLQEMPGFVERLRYARGVQAVKIGDTRLAGVSFAEVITNETHLLAPAASYNRGNLFVSDGQLEAAKEAYIDALKLNPDDVQAKINLELLLQRQKQERKGQLPKDALQQRGPLIDFWLRPEDSHQKGSGKESQRIWR